MNLFEKKCLILPDNEFQTKCQINSQKSFETKSLIQSNYFSSNIGYRLKKLHLNVITDFSITISHNKHNK